MKARSNRFIRKSSGFTLIELMIAIAIVGVLASIAVPAFSNYLGRARISEAINYAEGCKTGYLEYYSTNGALPANNTQANCPAISTDNVQGVIINAKGILIQLANKDTVPAAMKNNFIFLQPLQASGTVATAGTTIVAWRCAASTTSAGAAVTSVAKDLLPAICRNDPL